MEADVEAPRNTRSGPIELTVATWNIHGGVGTDGCYAPQRIVDVLTEIDADVVALQEVASQRAHENFLADLGHATGYRVVADPLYRRQGADVGNAVLSRHGIKAVSRIDLGVGSYEPRGALDVAIEHRVGASIRLLATHLGLRPSERRQQVKRLIAAVDAAPLQTTVLMGDVNEWYLWGRPLRWLHAHFRHAPASPRTFPARRPLFALDRIWISPPQCLRTLACHATPLARVASDHLPLVATIVV
ncbi:MAG TPA: endonuclease/exonuclease/phosphatase family protein [Casimicrobiaceae bacterium]|nr:endonuclease/exonuclease/phosphatase family protein [Casimicrobiaceae bacterium]